MSWRTMMGVSENETPVQYLQNMQKPPEKTPYAYIALNADETLKSTRDNNCDISQKENTSPGDETSNLCAEDSGDDREKPYFPCRAGLPCYHDRGGRCFYKSNWGPIADLDGCPMIFGLGEGEAHPDIDALYRQRERIEAMRKRAETPYWRASDGKS